MEFNLPGIASAPKVPDHELLRLIGRGSYGEIWLGRSLTGHWRAIKLVHRDRFDDESSYLREFRGITRFEPISREDPHFVDILHVGQSRNPDFFYFVMELADDLVGRPFDPATYQPKTLRRLMEQRGRYSAQQTTALGIQLARGLEALHRHGLIHRDIKPSNIIFVRDEPKLADLGLVTIAGEGSYVGTEGYVAPEGPFTARSDLFSLGKVLYETVSGKDRLDFPELPTSLGNAPEDAGLGKLNRIILQACAADPKLRYQTAAEMAAALEALAAGKLKNPPLVRWPRVLAMALPVLAATWWGLRTEPPALFEKSSEAVFVTSEPAGAQVVQGEKSLGVTPLTMARPAGVPFEITLHLAGWDAKRVRLEQEQTAFVRFAPGTLVLSSSPTGAQVELDGKPAGITPITVPDLKPGPKEVRLRKPGYLSSVQTAEIRPLETANLSIELRPADRPANNQPWTNSLGMRLVPVGDLYVCIWETRVADFERFATESHYEINGPMQSIRAEGQGIYNDSWKNPGFPQGPDHPVTGISWKDAQAFCAWLTEQEREAGLLLPDELYRLPTDGEWSRLVGLENEIGATPADRAAKTRNVYPWNGAFPPPSNRAGNYAGEEMRSGGWPANWRVITGFRDPFTRTSPVASFPPNPLGLYDLGGNLWEWCMDKFAATGDTRVLRGASWANVESSLLLSSARTEDMIDSRNDVYGFRCVLEVSPFASIECLSNPAGAEVWMDGHKQGVTPITLERVRPGEMEIEFHKPGFLTARNIYVIRPRSTEKFSVELEPHAFPDFSHAWSNSLAMRFVPFENLLVSVWETRVSDFRAFCQASGRDFRLPDFEQTDQHPVVLVNREDAEAFCAWLTEKERADGYLSFSMRYRLPTDAEWSKAAGLSEQGHTPHARDSKSPGIYPWGDKWPPQKDAGNFGQAFSDGFKQTSPAGAFRENSNGLQDLAGNVWEWCADPYGGAGTFSRWGVLRGGSWANYGPRVLLSSYRNVVMPTDRDVIYGFRCVLEQGE